MFPLTQIGSEIALAGESDPDGDTNVCSMGLWGIIFISAMALCNRQKISFEVSALKE